MKMRQLFFSKSVLFLCHFSVYQGLYSLYHPVIPGDNCYKKRFHRKPGRKTCNVSPVSQYLHKIFTVNLFYYEYNVLIDVTL